jgi:hypothetical protein
MSGGVSSGDRKSVTGLVDRLEQLMEEMIVQQRERTTRIAQRIQPNLSEDDLRDPHSFPQVNSRPEFAYEDGLLAGLISAQVALQREVGDHLRSSND